MHYAVATQHGTKIVTVTSDDSMKCISPNTQFILTDSPFNTSLVN